MKTKRMILKTCPSLITKLRISCLISIVNTIQTNSGETVTYTKLNDTASNLVTNKADIVAGVAATLVETGAAATLATVAQIGTLNTQVTSAGGGATGGDL